MGWGFWLEKRGHNWLERGGRLILKEEKVHFDWVLHTKQDGSLHLPEYDSMKWYLAFLASPWIVEFSSRFRVISKGKLSIVGKREKRMELAAPFFLLIGRRGSALCVSWPWVRYSFSNILSKYFFSKPLNCWI